MSGRALRSGRTLPDEGEEVRKSCSVMEDEEEELEDEEEEDEMWDMMRYAPIN